MYLKGLKVCGAQTFTTVLAIPSDISEEQCLKRIPTCLETERFFLDLQVTTHFPR